MKRLAANDIAYRQLEWAVKEKLILKGYTSKVKDNIFKNELHPNLSVFDFPLKLNTDNKTAIPVFFCHSCFPFCHSCESRNLPGYSLLRMHSLSL